MKIDYKKLYSYLAVIGLLFVWVFTEYDRREILMDEFSFLYDALLINYLLTTIIAFGTPFIIGATVYKITIKNKKIRLIDAFLSALLIFQFSIFLFVREFDWAFD